MQPDRERVNLVREQVVILTAQERIEGTFCYPRGTRLSDALNAPTAQRTKSHLPLVDATVTRLATGRQVLRSRFLLVAQRQIHVILPRSELLHEGQPEERAPGTLPAAWGPKDDSGKSLASEKDRVPELAKALRGGDRRGRRTAAEALAGMGPAARGAIPALVDATRDADEFVRGQAMEALGNIGLEARPAIPRLVEGLRDRSDFVRRVAARALGNIGSPSHGAVPALQHALRDRAEFVRSAAADALGKLGAAAASAVPALQAALADRDVLVRHWAALALEKIEEARQATTPGNGVG